MRFDVAPPHHVTVTNDLPLTNEDVQTMMDALFDIRVGVGLLVTELLEEDDEDGPGEEEED